LNALIFAVAIKVPLFHPTQPMPANIVALGNNLAAKGGFFSNAMAQTRKVALTSYSSKA